MMLLGRRECEEEERRAREDIERLRLAEAAQLQQEEKQRQVIQEWAAVISHFRISLAAYFSVFLIWVVTCMNHVLRVAGNCQQEGWNR